MPEEVMPDLDDILMKLNYFQDGVDTAGFETLDKVLKWDVGKRGKLKAGAEFAGEFAIKKAAGYAVSASHVVHAAAGAGLATTAAVAAFSGLGGVLGVWIGAAQVANAAFTSFKLWDLAPKAKGGSDLYPCTCGKCGDHAYWLAERHSENWAKFGASIFVLPALYTAPKAVYDKFGNSELSKNQADDGDRPQAWCEAGDVPEDRQGSEPQNGKRHLQGPGPGAGCGIFERLHAEKRAGAGGGGVPQGAGDHLAAVRRIRAGPHEIPQNPGGHPGRRRHQGDPGQNLFVAGARRAVVSAEGSMRVLLAAAILALVGGGLAGCASAPGNQQTEVRTGFSTGVIVGGGR